MLATQSLASSETVKKSVIISILLIVISILFLLVLPSLSLVLFGRDARFVSERVFVSLEVSRSILGLMMSIVLLERRDELFYNKQWAIGFAFLGMGLLGILNLVLFGSTQLSFLSAISGFYGAIILCFIWFNIEEGIKAYKGRLIALYLIITMLVGSFVWYISQFHEEILRASQGGLAVKMLNTAAGLLFLTAAANFIWKHMRDRKFEWYIFFCSSMLMGIPRLAYRVSVMWSASWWAWHVVQLTAYIWVLWYIWSDYRKTNRLLSFAISQHDILVEELRSAEHNHEILLQHLPQKIFFKDHMCKYVLCNDEYSQLFGLKTSDIVGKTDEILYPAEKIQEIHDEEIKVLNSAEIISRDEEMFIAGFFRYVHILKAPIFDEDGKVSGILGIYRDITDQKKTQQALDANMHDLERSNKELQEFAYVVSHDLNEPLRKLYSFAAILQDEMGDRVKDEEKEYLLFIVDGARRMQGLIKGLLEIARVGRGGIEREEVSLDDAVTDAISNLSHLIKEHSVYVERSPLPVLNVNRVYVTQLFQNLIHNAIKYRSDADACIEIGVEQEGSESIMYVKDNGVGIDPQFADRIFVIFQRVKDDADRVEGVGVGLSICKKIVELHGGRIWVESTRGNGSVFKFSLKA